ncbi:ABC transporter substrate-binding protein [uncultured Shewanella sp.]|uniref:MlaC/ttg2D family ABC transporter substrate-binding protein n=1 Tax=uncultured Shewanella sp. TaxID=173975 RepID=UPI0026163023|nr:ABC transporter substrate-binding protein [uncultured Shewanella sp.]
MLKKLLASAVTVILLGANVSAFAQDTNVHTGKSSADQKVVDPTSIVIDTKNPYLMIEGAANKTFASFHKQQAKIKADPNYLKVIIQDDLMPYIDSRYASYKVMGQYLRDSTKEQRNNFVKAFTGYLVTTYAQAFTEYTDQTIQFSPAENFANEKIVSVDVQVIEKGRPPIKLTFKVRRLKDDTWKAFDLIAEGVSLLSTKQSEIGNLIRQQGIDKVIETLNEKAQQSITSQSSEKSE